MAGNGSGSANHFLHGTWQDSSQWLELLPYLSGDYHCFVVDLPGCGESEPLPIQSISAQVQSLQEYLERLNINKFCLVGHSLGAWVAVSYALKFPERVKGLVLMAPEGVQGLRQGWSVERSLLSPLPVFYWALQFLRPWAKLLGKTEGIQKLLQLRRKLRSHPVPCRILFQRRPAEIYSEMVDRHLDSLKTPLLLLQEPAADERAIALTKTYENLVPTAVVQIISSAMTDPTPEVAAYIREFLGVVG
ncbi:MAG: alpha/beta hydrolase [Coleofasciculaceae cyanobacterium SM2_1_6]|nr:alpha/beta hydrolase [Coleofasciculaceae cyanobacterium SM2_1_6]